MDDRAIATLLVGQEQRRALTPVTVRRSPRPQVLEITEGGAAGVLVLDLAVP